VHSSRLLTATAVTPKYSPCSTAHGASAIAGRMQQPSTIDHIAFEITLADFAGEKERLEALGLRVETAEHTWVHWRSLLCDRPGGVRSSPSLNAGGVL
jgi:hypothetical protein